MILYGLGLFCFCMLLHVFMWRCRVPYMSSLLLLVIFVAPAFLITLFTTVSGALPGVPLILPEVLGALLLHLSFSAAYIASYPAARAISPSLDILLIIEGSKDGSISKEELKNKFNDIRLVNARIDDLKDYHFMSKCGNSFSLGLAGKIVVALFTAYRRLLGLPQGEG